MEAPEPVPGSIPIREESWALLSLSGRLEDLCRDLRRSVEHEFQLSERQLKAQQLADLEAEKMRAEAKAKQQQAKIEELEGEVKTLKGKLETKQKQVKESLAFASHVRQHSVARASFEKAFRTWQAEAAAAKHEKLQMAMASKVCAMKTSTHLLCTWRQAVQSSSRERLLAHERASANAMRAKLFEQMEMERNQLVAEVAELKNQLHEETKQRALLQDNLKRVFMRGVCALNFEAMSLLNDPAGASPALTAPLAKAAEILAAQEDPGLPAAPVAPAVTLPVEEQEPIAVVQTATVLPTSGENDDTLQPQASPTPLPFVSYTGPARKASIPKSQRWQAVSPAERVAAR